MPKSEIKGDGPQTSFLDRYPNWGAFLPITTTQEAPMQFTIARPALMAAIRLARIAVPSKSSNPLLVHLLLDADPARGLTITATDLETLIAVTTPAEVKAAGRATLPAALAGSMLAQCTDPTLTVRLDKDRVRLTGAGTKLALPTLDPDEYPDAAFGIASQPLASCPVGMFRTAVERVAFAAAGTDDGRAVLAGVQLDFAGPTLTLAAADGYRLATTALPVDGPDDARASRWIVPAIALAELVAALPEGTLTIGLARNTLTLDVDDAVRARVRTIDGLFPEFRQLVPTVFTLNARASRVGLQNAAKLAELAAGQTKGSKGAGFTRLDVAIGPEGLVVRGTEAATEAEVAVPLLAGAPEATYLTRVDAGFLVQALGAVAGETVELRGNRPDHIFVVAPSAAGDATLHGIMPMHVNEGAA